MSAPAAAQDPTRLAVSGLTVTYHNGHTALRDAGFTLEGGTRCALLSVNGSGKSTLFKSIMGMVHPSAGLIRLNDLPVALALRQNLVAYVPQSEEVDWHFPVLVDDVVMMGRYGKMFWLVGWQAFLDSQGERWITGSPLLARLTVILRILDSSQKNERKMIFLHYILDWVARGLSKFESRLNSFETLYTILCKCLFSEVTVQAVTELDNKAAHCHAPVPQRHCPFL